jgi:hypothetical protein
MGRGRSTDPLICILCLILTATSITVQADEAPDQTAIPSDLQTARKQITPIQAFRPTAGLDRHDPSNVIAHDGRFWVFYTHNRGDHQEVAVHAGSSADGLTWEDHGLVVGRGAAGGWDESGAIAPFCVQHAGRFYLFYTGFRDGDLASRDLGLAIADHPRGPWRRWEGNPVLCRSPAPEAWDSGMLGDSNVVLHNDRWWLFFKSRRHDQGPRDTRIGVATADRITGPYLKHPDNPLFAGHAFSLWRHHHGLAALCGEVSPAILWSSDGRRFHPVGEFPNSSAGLYTPDSEADPEHRHGFDWGLDVVSEGGSRGLVRFDCER